MLRVLSTEIYLWALSRDNYFMHFYSFSTLLYDIFSKISINQILNLLLLLLLYKTHNTLKGIKIKITDFY